MIRSEQIGILTTRRRAILAHVRRYFPALCAALFPHALEDKLARAVNRASAYRFQSYVDVQQFVNLCLMLGEDFELSPEFAWAARILNDPNPAAARFRSSWLYDRVIHHLASIEQTDAITR